MISREAAVRYANAFFSLASERGELEQIEKDFIRVRELVVRHPEITHLILNSTVPPLEKEDFIEKVVADQSGTQPLLIHFLKVLIKKRRFQELGTVQEEFHRLFEKKRGVQEVRVISAVPLSRANEEKLKSVLEKKFELQIRLLTETDPSLIGGFVIRFDGREINASFRSRLDEIKQKLMA